jgi:hypothetical protein
MVLELKLLMDSVLIYCQLQSLAVTFFTGRPGTFA